MKKQTLPVFVLTLALSCGTVAGPRLWADDFVITGTRVIDNTVSLTTERYDNQGTLRVDATGKLEIGADVTNLTSLGEGISGLNLGLADIRGTIDAKQDIRFHEGTSITGEIFSTKTVIFDGGSTISGSIHADGVAFSGWTLGAEEGAESTTTYVDLSGGAELDVKTILVNGPVEIKTASDGNGGTKAFVAENLILGYAGAELRLSGDLEVTGNYMGYVSTKLFSNPDEYGGGAGTIILRGGGEAVKAGEGYDAVNNYIEQGTIFATNLQLEGSTLFVNTYASYGNVTVAGDGSTVRALKGFSANGSFLVEKGATVRLDGATTDNMIYNNKMYKYFNGLFYDGFTLQNGATMEATSESQSLALAVANTTYIGEASESPIDKQAVLKGQHMTLTGMDSVGNMAVRKLYNRGKILTTGTLELNALELTNTGGGTIQTNTLKLLQQSVLTLHANDSLVFVGTAPSISIGSNSKIDASGRQLDFTGVAITNSNADGGIIAQSLHFGEGASLTGAGKTLAHTVFDKGSTVLLTSAGNLDFGDKEVRFADGSNIQMTINSGVGMIQTTGKVVTEGTTTLKIADGSKYNGRTKTYEIIRGGEGSEYNGEIELAESLFFSLSDWGYSENSLYVEIVKVADLVDFAKSHNQRELAHMIDVYLNDGGAHQVQESLFGAVMNSQTDASYRRALDSVSGVSRENAVLFALSSPWRIPLDNIGFKRLSLTMEEPRFAQTGADGLIRGQTRRFNPTWKKEKEKEKTSPRVADVPKRRQSTRTGYGTPHDLWFDSFYQYSKIDSDGNAPGGEGHRGGFYAGFGLPSPSRESLVGLSVGYTGGQYKQRKDKTDIDDFQIGVYGGTNLFGRNLQLRGYLGLGFQDYSIERNVQLDGYLPLPVSGKSEGMSMAAALYLLRPVDVSERFIVKGLFGIDVESIRQDGFTESGYEAATLKYDSVSLTRAMLRLGLTGDYAFDQSTLYGRFLLGVKVAGDDTAFARRNFVYTPGSQFGIDSVNLKTVAFDVGFGGNFALNRSRSASLLVDYNTNFTTNTNSHAVSLGFLWQR